MNIAIIYVSKTGVTEEVVETIKKTTKHSVDTIDLLKVRHPDLSDYEAFVIGAPVYVGRPHKKVRRFIAKEAKALRQKPLILFVVGADKQVDLDTMLNESYPPNIVDHAAFKVHCGAYFNFDRMSAFSRFIIKQVGKSKQKAGEVHTVELDTDAIQTLIESIDAL